MTVRFKSGVPEKGALFHHRVHPIPGEEIHLIEISKEHLADPSLMKKGWACQVLAADRHWRPSEDKPGYDEAAVDKHILKGWGAISPEERQRGFGYMTKAIENGHAKFFLCVATHGKTQRVVGIASLTDWTKNQNPAYHNLGVQLSRLYVLPGYEQMKLGVRMLRAVEDYAHSIGVERLYLESTKHADGFYLKHGYREAPADDPRNDTSGSAIIGQLMYKDLGPRQEREPLSQNYSGRTR